jgi:hypothetical protein
MPGEYSQDRRARTRHLEQDSQDRIARIGQPGSDSQQRTARTGHPDQARQIGKAENERQNRFCSYKLKIFASHKIF